jgi:hypothetical protein
MRVERQLRSWNYWNLMSYESGCEEEREVRCIMTPRFLDCAVSGWSCDSPRQIIEVVWIVGRGVA